MKAFHFSLQAVRTLRRRQEQFAIEAFGRAVRARQLAEAKQREAGRVLGAAWEQLALLQAERAAVFQINQVRGHCRVLEQRLADSQVVVAAAQEAANQAWEGLQAARRQLDLVEKLYLRRWHEHERALREDEQKQLDELAGRRWLVDPILMPPTARSLN